MFKRALVLGLAVFLCTAAPGALARSTRAHAARHTVAVAAATRWQTRTLASLQQRSLYLERVMHAAPARVLPAAKRSLASARTPRERARILIHLWQRVYTRTAASYRRPPLLAQLTCIHDGEGSWNDTRNPVYDGGLQMDYAFQSRYAPFLLRLKGRAYNWTPLEQIWTAVYAITGPDHRGFYPWPMTARACGLI